MTAHIKQKHVARVLFHIQALLLIFFVFITPIYCFAEIAAPEIAAPEIKGKWIQGALLIGKTQAGNQVYLGKKKLYIDESGQFVFGLGREAKLTQHLKIVSREGRSQEFTYKVEPREYDIQRIEGVEKKYVEPPKEVLARIANDNALIGKARGTMRYADQFSAGFTWPLIGEITGVYGSQRVFNGVPKRPHYGLDIAGPVGAEVVAPAPGLVTLAHDDMYYSGGTLIIDHGQGVSSTFIHLSKILVKEGDVIKRGQPIANVGATGRVTGPHLDWRINWTNQRLDPYLLLPPMPEAANSAVDAPQNAK